MTFKDLGLEDNIVEAIEHMGITTPTSVQEQAIPLVLKGKDVIAQSATGSGKTLAFSAGIIQQIEKGNQIKALILVPTRELAEQLQDSIKKFAKLKKLHVTTIYGGVSINNQIKNLKEADIVIGTPGRTLDHLKRGSLNLDTIEFLVLDEADRMLDMGFLPDIKLIIKKCPEKRQTLFFSATFNNSIMKITKQFLKNPETITLETYVDPTKMDQIYYDVPNRLKLPLLLHFLKEEKETEGPIMVFCNSQQNTDFIADKIRSAKLHVIKIHGGLTQDKRTKAIKTFSEKGTILVCTDVAARGLDVPGVSHVYNYDIPQDSKQYVHRIGRTARAGKSGKVINILGERDHDNFRRVLQDNDFEIIRGEKPFISPELMKVDQTRSSHDGRGGPRGGSRGRGRSNSRGRSQSGHSRSGSRSRSSGHKKRKQSTHKRS